jgi:predicted nucleotidyltransferase
MNIFDDYTHNLLKELNNNKVEYIVVGGYAVNYHGYRRTTGDIDLWIKPEND